MHHRARRSTAWSAPPTNPAVRNAALLLVESAPGAALQFCPLIRAVPGSFAILTCCHHLNTLHCTMNEPKAYSRFTLRQPARTYAQLLAQLKSKAFKRPPRRDGELKAFMAFVASVRDSVTDRKALRLPGDTSSFWRPLITNNGDEKMAWAIHK